MIQALVFDFDGLILETEGPIYQSWQELYQEYGLEIPFEVWADTIGTIPEYYDPIEELEKKTGKPVADRQGAESRRLQRELDLVAALPVLPGVLTYLEEARSLGLKIGLASSSPRTWVMGHLTRLNLVSYFDSIWTSTDTGIAKPDPALYLAVLGSFSLSGNQAVALEDSPYGIRSAKAAGMYCVAVPNKLTARLSLQEADLQLNSLAELSLHELLIQLNSHSTPAAPEKT